MTPDRADVMVVQAMVDTMVGIPKFSYPARQREAVKPSGEFAHIRLIEEYQVGIPAQKIVEQTNETTTFYTYSPVRLRFRIGVVDTTGLPSSKILHGWTTEAMKAQMISSGYGFIKCDPLSSEDAKLEKEWEYRKGFSVELYTTRVFQEVVDNISQLTVTGSFVDEALTEHLLNFNINNN
tara:strand:- start:12190 stop:12729 length:540 start_codon:yes stop_codon:yes gene_type:complete